MNGTCGERNIRTRTSSITTATYMVMMKHGNMHVIRNIYIVAIFVLMLAISACGNKSRRVRPSADRDKVVKEQYHQADSSKKEEAKTQQEETRNKKDEVKVPSTPASSSRRRSSSSSNYDNMRGFDPASEDDMDDNGSCRYMDNYDEEGWD